MPQNLPAEKDISYIFLEVFLCPKGLLPKSFFLNKKIQLPKQKGKSAFDVESVEKLRCAPMAAPEPMAGSDGTLLWRFWDPNEKRQETPEPKKNEEPCWVFVLFFVFWKCFFFFF